MSIAKAVAELRLQSSDSNGVLCLSDTGVVTSLSESHGLLKIGEHTLDRLYWSFLANFSAEIRNQGSDLNEDSDRGWNELASVHPRLFQVVLLRLANGRRATMELCADAQGAWFCINVDNKEPWYVFESVLEGTARVESIQQGRERLSLSENELSMLATGWGMICLGTSIEASVQRTIIDAFSSPTGLGKPI